MSTIGKIPATKADLNELRQDLANLEHKVDEIAERLDHLPTKQDIQAMFTSVVDLVTLKAEHERMKQIIREKLHAEL